MTLSSGIRVVAGALVLLAVLATPAMAATASVTASPDTGLSDGATVTASVAGFAPAENVLIAQCAAPEGNLVCDWAGHTTLTTDDSGAGTVDIVVLSSFTGFSADGTPWGVVDCATVAGGCLIGATNETWTTTTTTPISFG